MVSRNRVQLAPAVGLVVAGLLLQLSDELDAMAEWAPVGERSLTLGAGTRF